MPKSAMLVTISVKSLAPNAERTLDVTYNIPADQVVGLTIPPAGKTKIGTAVERLAQMLEENQTDL